MDSYDYKLKKIIEEEAEMLNEYVSPQLKAKLLGAAAGLSLLGGAAGIKGIKNKKYNEMNYGQNKRVVKNYTKSLDSLQDKAKMALNALKMSGVRNGKEIDFCKKIIKMDKNFYNSIIANDIDKYDNVLDSWINAAHGNGNGMEAPTIPSTKPEFKKEKKSSESFGEKVGRTAANISKSANDFKNDVQKGFNR